MAKSTGITTSLTIDNAAGAGQDISNDVTSVTTNTPRGLQDVTGLDKAAMERLLLLSDGTITVNGVHNSALSHTVFSTLHSSDATRTVVIGYPSATLTMEMVISEYSLNRAQDGSLTYTANLSLANGTAPAWT